MTDYKWKVKRGSWKESDHPRDGIGQFTNKNTPRIIVRFKVGNERSGNWSHAGRPGQVGGSAASGFSDHGHNVSESELDEMWNGVSQWDGSRAGVGSAAIDGAVDGFGLASMRDGDELVAIASYDLDGPVSEFVGKGYEEIAALATKRGGYGREMMARLAQSAYERGHGIALHAAPEAVGFYRKLGMARSRKGKDVFFLGKAAIPQFIDKWREK